MAVVDSTMHVPHPGRASAYLDWLQMLTGAGLILFMWSHMILVSSVLVGPRVMDALAWFFEYTYVAQVGGPLVAFVFLLHFALGARKIPFRTAEQRVVWAHSRTLRHRDTWLWLVQVVSAMVVLLLGSIHMWIVLTDLPITSVKSAARIQSGWLMPLYLVLLPMVELHVGIGFYRIGVKWGFIRRANRGIFRRRENLLTLFFILLGLATLLRFYFMDFH
ncbi:fumarate reductase subunit C [Desulfobaculum xiamenense]|uniref:Fumarate reductase subunit C n=1 Tax=Desulfobaculum xiamenense TaxID=995050 RepID=A0A846QMJ2_9BACT|nr:succinate dehydrogenase/fumarate reductase cytochrome b subunit [Desulfobaculum xiamenense]NJB69358.1 fumarate reductase subunit C [Desulfobaculum xiamenense]